MNREWKEGTLPRLEAEISAPTKHLTHQASMILGNHLAPRVNSHPKNLLQ